MWSTGIIIGVAFAAFVGLLSLALIIVLINKRNKPAKAVQPEYNALNNSQNTSFDTRNNDYRPSPNLPAVTAIPTSSLLENSADETMQVLYNYVPNLQDEIYLYVGDPVIIKARFDDGWALGYNVKTETEGSFPLACVGPFNNSRKVNGNASFGQRHSSLYLPSEATRESAYQHSKYDSTYQY